MLLFLACNFFTFLMKIFLILIYFLPRDITVLPLLSLVVIRSAVKSISASKLWNVKKCNLHLKKYC